MRYLTSKADGTHPLEADLAPVDGKSEETPDVEPIGVTDVDLTYNAEPDPVDHEVDTSGLHPMEVPRHDRYADENTAEPTPERVIPGGVTNAHPDFSVDSDGEIGPGHKGMTSTADLSTGGGPTEIEVTDGGEVAEGTAHLPAGNAAREEWVAYAISQGMTEEEVTGYGRNDLRDLYTAEA